MRHLDKFIWITVVIVYIYIYVRITHNNIIADHYLKVKLRAKEERKANMKDIRYQLRRIYDINSEGYTISTQKTKPVVGRTSAESTTTD